MIITEHITKLHNDYQNINNRINNSIRYTFDHNGSRTSIYFTCENELQNQIILTICYNDTYYITPKYFSENNGVYNMTGFIPTEIYPHIRDIFADNNYSPSCYFEHMLDAILNTAPVGKNFLAEINRHPYYNYENTSERPFFETFTRQNMSPAMRDNIQKRFDFDLANRILEYCDRTNKTLRFSSHIERNHDILIALNNAQD